MKRMPTHSGMKQIIMITAASFATACGSVTTTSKSAFKVRMQGTYVVPNGATGTGAPQSQTYLLKNVLLTAADGTPTSLITADPATYKIIDRPQLLYANYDMTDYDGLTFSKASVVFDSAVVVKTKQSTQLNIALDSGTLDLVQNFTIDKSTTQTLTIKAAWAKTITDADDGTQTASAPTFSMTFSSD